MYNLCLKVFRKYLISRMENLEQGSAKHRFSEALLNSDECRGTHSCGQRNDKLHRSGASGGLKRWFSLANLRCGSCFDRKSGFKQHFFLLLVAKDR